jgi:hypothetical protein
MPNCTKTLLGAALCVCLAGLSCENGLSGGGNASRQDKGLQSALFHAYDYREPKGANSSGNYYTLKARQMAVGTHCEVWVENGFTVSRDDAQAIIDEYDQKIYPRIRDAFGMDIEFRGETMNLMEAGDYYSNNDGRLLFLLMDIKEPVSEDGGYIAGMFNTTDLGNSSYSNKADMIYLDINPGKIKTPTFYATIAHELQHLLHFMMDIGVRSSDMYKAQDIWINEGLSTVAEYVYLGSHNATDRVKYFNKVGLSEGNTFLVWDGVLDDYATVYLFFQWLRIQGGSSQLYRDILASPHVGSTAVTTAAAQYPALAPVAGTWATLLRSWFAANYINAPANAENSIFGYKGELQTAVVPVSSPNYTSQLRPGEGVYSNLSQVPSLSQSGSIVYASLDKAAQELTPQPGAVVTGQINDRLLLTFNANPNPGGSPEKGTIAISDQDPPASQAVSARRAAAWTTPYPRSVSDTLGGRDPGKLDPADWDSFRVRVLP